MRKVINKKAYDTKTARFIAGYHNRLSRSDFRYLSEDLYVTKNGQHFLHAEGGAKTIYSESSGSSSWGIETIILLLKEEVYDWLEKRDHTEVIEEIFKDEIQEG